MVTQPRQARRSSCHDAPCFRTSLRPLAAALMVALCNNAFALPTDPTIVSGQAAVNAAGTTGLVVNQSSAKAAIDWRTFSVGSNETVRFNQPSTAAVTVNRVTTNDPSQILGKISALGSVFLINPSGIIFGRDAVVDVGSLVASTLTASSADLLSGRYVFGVAPGGSGSVRNEGRITAAEGGSVTLIGTQVSNSGAIATPGGTTGLIAGERVNIDFDGDGLVRYQVDAGAAPMLVENTGQIIADGGRVALQAGTRDALLDTVLNVDGVVRARSISRRNGEIYLDGGGSGVVQVSGTLDASGTAAGVGGGQVRVLGESVGLFGSAHIDASGEAGGGAVLIGGNYQGGGAEHNATRSYVGSGASIAADATGSGDGGKVIVWADDWTRFYGSIRARGGTLGGDGGFVEVSGKRNLAFSGDVNTGAVLGRAGMLLLDPENLYVVSGSTDPVAPSDGDGSIFRATGDSDKTYYVSTTSLQRSDLLNYTLEASGTVKFVDSVAFNGVDGNEITVIGHTGINTSGATISTKGASLSLTAPEMTLGAITTNVDTATGGGNLTINATSSTRTFTQDGAFTLGSGKLIKDGTGTLNLSRANTYTGDTKVKVGTITVSNAAGLGFSAVQVDSGATLNIDGVTIAPASINIAGGGVGGAGALTGTGTASYSGSLALSGAAAVGATAGSTLTLGAINGGVGDSLIKLGDGTVVLGGPASYSGGTTIGDGVLTAGNASALGLGGTVTVTSGGTLNIADGITLEARTPISLSGTLRGTGNAGYDGTVTLAAATARIDTPIASDTLTLGAAMGGSSALTKIGAGTLKLSGDNSYSGGTAINGGTVLLNSGSTLPDRTAVSFSGAGSKLELNGTNQHIGSLGGPGTIQLGGGALWVTQNVDNTFSGTIAGTGDLTKDGSATLTLTSAGGYAGTTSVKGGMLTLQGAGSLGSGSVSVASGATLHLDGVALTSPGLINLAGIGWNDGTHSYGALWGTGSASYTGELALTAPATIHVGPFSGASTDRLTLTAGSGGTVISGSPSYALTKTGLGTLELASGSASYGNTAIQAGTLSVSSDALGSGDVSVASGATLNINNTTLRTPSSIQLSGNGMDGAGALTGTGTARFTGAIALPAATSIGVGAGSTFTLNDNRSGAGNLTKLGPGTLVLGGSAAAHSGATTINTGILTAASSTAFGPGSVAVDPGATLNIADGITLAAGTPISLSGTLRGTGNAAYDGTVTLAAATARIDTPIASDTLTLREVMGGSSALTKIGAGMLKLSGANRYAGGTTISDGVLTAGNASALGLGGTVTVTSGGTLNIADGITLAAGTPISLSGTLRGTGTAGYDGAVTLAAATARIDTPIASDTLTLREAMGGSSALTKIGAGTLKLSGDNRYTGGTTISDGVLTAGNASALGLGGTVTVTSGGTLNIADGITLEARTPISLSGTLRGTGNAVYDGTVTLAAATARIDTPIASDTLTLREAMGGSSALTKIGAGTLKLSGANSYSGGTAINGGTVLLNSGSTLPDRTAVSFSGAGSKLELNGTNQHIGNLGGPGTIQLGGGELWVTQNVHNTFSGTIAGTGNLTKDGPATLTLTSAGGYAGTTSVTGGMLTLQGAGSLGSGSVTVASGATLHLDGVALTSPGLINLAGTGWSDGTHSYGALWGTGSASYTGELALTSPATIHVGPFSGASTDRLTLNAGSGGTVISGGISRNLTKTGLGTLEIATGSASFGNTAIQAGTLSVRSDALGVGDVSVGSGATLNINNTDLRTPSSIQLSGNGMDGAGAMTGTGTARYTGVIALPAASSIGVGAGSTFTLDGNRSGAGNLTKLGPGTLVLRGSAATHSGATTINTGILTAASNSAFGPGSVAVDPGATLNIADGVILGSPSSINLAGSGVTISGRSVGALWGTGAAAYSGGVRLASDAEITAAAGGTLTIAGAVTGAMKALTVDGSGTVVLAAGANSLGSVIQRADSTLKLGANQSIETSGAQNYRGTLLGADATLRSTEGEAVSAAGGANHFTGSLTLDTTGTASLAGRFGSLSARTGALVFGTTTIDNNASLTARGDIGQTGALRVGGITTLAAGGNPITLSNAGNDFVGPVSVTGGTTVLSDANALNIVLTGTGPTTLTAASLNASGTASSLLASTPTGTLTSSVGTAGDAIYHAGSALNLGATHIGGKLDATAAGPISQTGALDVGGMTTLDAGGNAITLYDAGNDFVGAVSATAGTTALRDANALSVALTTGATTLTAASLNASGTVSSLLATTTGTLASSVSTASDATYHAGSALVLGASTIGGNALLTASGNIRQMGTTDVLMIGGTTTIDAGGNAITLSNVGNDFVGAVSATGGTTTLRDANALNVALSTGATTLTAASLNASGAASSLLATTTGTLASSVSTARDVSYLAGSALVLGASTIGGKLDATAAGPISQTGVLDVTGSATIDAGNQSVTLVEANRIGGLFSIITTGPASLAGRFGSLDAHTGALTLGATTIDSNALLTASGNVRQMGSTDALMIGGTTTIDAGGNAITLSNMGNDFVGAVSATGGTTTLRDANALNVALSTGATTLTAASLNASGAASSLLATTTGTLASSVSTASDATYHAGSALVLSASTIGGKLDATAAGPISQTGVLDVTGSATFDAGGNSIDLSTGANLFRSPMVVTGGTTVIASDHGKLAVSLATGDTQLSADEIEVSGSMALTNTTSRIRSPNAIPLGNLSITGSGSLEIISDAVMGSSEVSNVSVQNAIGVPNKLTIYGASIYQQAGARILTGPSVTLLLNANGVGSIDLSADASVAMSDPSRSTTRLGDLLSVFSKATGANRTLTHDGTNQIQGGISAITKADESQGTNQPKTIVAIASDTITVAPGSIDPVTSVRKPSIDADSVMLVARAINGGGGKIQTHVAATALGDGRNIATGPTRAEDKDYAILPSIFVIAEPNTSGYSFGTLDVPISVSFGAIAGQTSNSLLQTISVDPFNKDGSSGQVPVYLGTNLQPGEDPVGPIKRYLVFPIDIPKNAIRAVVVDGVKIEDSSAYDAVQTAVAEILNQVRKEQLESGFSNENVAAQLRKGVVTETRVGQAAVDRFQGVAPSQRCVGLMIGEMVVCAPAAGPAQ